MYVCMCASGGEREAFSISVWLDRVFLKVFEFF